MAGEITPQLSAPLADDQVSFFNTQMVAHNHPQLQLQGFQCFLTSVYTKHTCGVHTCMQQNTHTQNVKSKILN